MLALASCGQQKEHASLARTRLILQPPIESHARRVDDDVETRHAACLCVLAPQLDVVRDVELREHQRRADRRDELEPIDVGSNALALDVRGVVHKSADGHESGTELLRGGVGTRVSARALG
eukprot:Amastigsp_a846541_10.p5 type:complete len:121 gc:universal Amastigsp_a846541_10:1603-1241(-)